MKDSCSVLLADDHTILRQGLRALLEREKEFAVVAEASDGLAAIRAVQELHPDVVIIDLSMPRMNGIEAIREMRKESPESKIIVLTVHEEEEYVFASLAAGANGYVLKDADNSELILAMRSALKGKTYLTPGISNTVLDVYLKTSVPQKQKTSLDFLTERELIILKLVAEGHRSKEIADLLFISPKTVDKHRENLMRKLDMHSISALTSFAMKHGLLS